jgi:serine protease Do
VVLLALLVSGAPAQVRDRTMDEGGRAWLGIYIRNLERDDARRLDLRAGTDGVLVSGVDDQGPASEAGLRTGDVITEIDGRTVRDQRAFVRAIQQREPGERVRLTVWRDGRTQSYTVELQARSGDAEKPRLGDDAIGQATPPDDAQPRRLPGPIGGSRPRLGVEVMELNPDLAEYFDTRTGEGVLVTRVAENSGAARAGLRAGDVILRVEDRTVRRVEDLHAAVAEHRAGDSVEVTVQRRGREERFQVEVNELALPGLGSRRLFESQPGSSFGDDTADLQRQIRELQRRIDELEREVRAQRRR